MFKGNPGLVNVDLPVHAPVKTPFEWALLTKMLKYLAPYALRKQNLAEINFQSPFIKYTFHFNNTQPAIPLIFNSSKLDALQAEFHKLDFNRTTFSPLFEYYGTPETRYMYRILTADSVYMKELLINWNFHIKSKHKSLEG